jgi:UDP-2,4-diacetamido-2,4,6-trideoxy-beta-L-altropyranose hydrolase
MQNRTAIFRCDASPDIGGGHLMRCLTLADELRNTGWVCSFLVASGAVGYSDLAKQRGYEIKTLSETAPKCDLMVIDHYYIDEAQESFLAQNANAVLVIDDLASRKHPADILLDHTYGRTADDYKNLVPSECQMLLGAEYALLRPQFAEQRDCSLRKRQSFRSLQRVILFITSVDTHGWTKKILSVLNKMERPLQIDVVLDESSKDFNQIKSAPSPHNLAFYSNVPDMAALMADADLAIGAGGTTNWERCSLALPSIVVNIADNQDTVIKNLAEEGAIVSVGKITENGFENLLKSALQDVLQWTAKDYIHKSEIAGRICDGKGTVRVTAFLNDFFTRR